MERELSEKPEEYTNGGIASEWVDRVVDNWQLDYGTHARNLQHSCKIGYSHPANAKPDASKSKSYRKGGFDLLPVGLLDTAGGLNLYGTSSYCWTASAFGATQSGYGWCRIIPYNQDYVTKQYLMRDRYMSVRCKQD